VSTGVDALEPEVRSYVDAGETLGMAELVNRLLAHEQRLGAFAHDGLWLDMAWRADHELAQLGPDEIRQTAPNTAAGPSPQQSSAWRPTRRPTTPEAGSCNRWRGL
jgi:hypothetical protein